MNAPAALSEALAMKKATASNVYIVRIGKSNVAFGMLWSLLPGVKGSGKEIRKLADDHAANAYVSLPAEGKQPMIGLLPIKAHTLKGASRACKSAAALLALEFNGQITNALFGFEVAKGRVALIGFREGMPLIGFDRVVSRDDVEEVTADFLSVLDKQSNTIKFFGAPGLFGARQAADFQLEWFSTATKKAVKAARVRRAKPRVALFAGVALVAIAAWIGHGEYEAHQAKIRQAKAKQVAQDPNEAYAKSVAAYLGDAGYPVAFLAGPLSDYLNRMPLNHNGWRYEGGTCKPGSCTLTWTNAYGGTFKSFSESPLPGIPAYKTAYKEGMTGIETTFDIPVAAERGVRQDYLPTQEKFIVYFGSTLQQLRRDTGVSLSMQNAALIGLPEGVPGVTEETLKAPVREGTWTLNGEWVLYDVLTTLPPNMTIEEITVNGTGQAWTMNVTGKYYVKN